jgi:chromosome segregation ATPase
MLKKAIIGTVAATSLGTFLFGRDAVSYVKTGVGNIRDAVRAEVPLTFEMERAKKEVQALVPEIHKSLKLVAEQQVEVDNLREVLAQKETDLTNQQEAILALNKDLKSGETQFVYAGHTYTAGEVQRDLSERFNRFKIAEEAQRAQQQILAAKEQALASHRETLEGMLSQKKDLEVQLEGLMARMQTIEARKQVTSLSIDESKLARAKALIREIDQKLDVEARLLDAEGNFAGLIPVETKTEVPVDIARQVESYFQRETAAVTASGESTDTDESVDAVDAKIAALQAEQ